jgi:hypothetical protein
VSAETPDPSTRLLVAGICLEAPRGGLVAGLTVRDLRIGSHKLDIRFWTEGSETAFEVIKGDPHLVERCDIATKAGQLRLKQSGRRKWRRGR